MSLDFKLRPQHIRSFAPPKPTVAAPLVLAVQPTSSSSSSSSLAFWTIAARGACVVAVFPLLLLPSSDDAAACLHLTTMPITAYILQKYNHLRYAVGPQCFMSFFCIFFTNIVAVTLLLLRNAEGYPAYFLKIPLYFLAMALCVATLQLLWVVEKRVVPRVMLCTATSMLILVLILVAILAPTPTMSRRFFQSTTLPLLLLFMETSKLPARRSALVEVDEEAAAD
jgi:hypothetical protein